MGIIRTLAQNIVLTNPTTNTVELLDLTFHYADPYYATLRYQVLDSAGKIRGKHTIRIEDAAFTDLVSGFGPTLLTRCDALIWTDIQANYAIS